MIKREMQERHNQAMSYLIPRPEYVDLATRKRSERFLRDLIDDIGPAVRSYPSWHPLVCNYPQQKITGHPNRDCGYEGLDHTVQFVRGFITCPYDDGQQVIDSVEALPRHPRAIITAERLDAKLYNPEATPILVRCDWFEGEGILDAEGRVRLHVALPLMLEQELPCWRWADVAETWETMRDYFLGEPNDGRSSTFVSSETTKTMKKVWNELIHTGMFGPIKINSR